MAVPSVSPLQVDVAMVEALLCNRAKAAIVLMAYPVQDRWSQLGTSRSLNSESGAGDLCLRFVDDAGTDGEVGVKSHRPPVQVCDQRSSRKTCNQGPGCSVHTSPGSGREKG